MTILMDHHDVPRGSERNDVHPIGRFEHVEIVNSAGAWRSTAALGDREHPAIVDGGGVDTLPGT
jgi:hypothetical protein